MRKNLAGWCSAILLSSVCAYAADAFQIKGTVLDSAAGTPVAGAEVSLPGAKVKTTTDASGYFTLGGNSTTEISDIQAGASPFTLSGQTISLTAEKTASLSISAYDLRGQSIKIFKGTVSHGVHSFDLSTGIRMGFPHRRQGRLRYRETCARIPERQRFRADVHQSLRFTERHGGDEADHRPRRADSHADIHLDRRPGHFHGRTPRRAFRQR